MSNKDQKPSSAINRWWLVLAVVAVVVALFMAVRNSGSQPPTAPAPAAEDSPETTREEGTGDDPPPVSGQVGLAPPRATRSSLNRETTTDGEPAASQFPQVERLLLDNSLSETQAAEGLLAIVRDSTISTEERDEALAHGLNLDFGIFGALATDPALPVPLAQRYFDELANRNEMPAQQIEGYLGLTSHSDGEIRTQAATQLAFVLENEDLAEAPDDLRRLALEKLEVLKAEPQENDAPASEPPANVPNPE